MTFCCTIPPPLFPCENLYESRISNLHHGIDFGILRLVKVLPTISTAADNEKVSESTRQSGPLAFDMQEVEKEEILVGWDGDGDLENPQNWSTAFKSWVTFQLSLLAFAASLASSITAPANRTIAAYVGVSQTVVVLNVSLYM